MIFFLVVMMGVGIITVIVLYDRENTCKFQYMMMICKYVSANVSAIEHYNALTMA